MSKFKVGDLVRIEGSTYHPVRETLSRTGKTYPVLQVEKGRIRVDSSSANKWWYNDSDVTLIRDGETSVQRRTFKQLKDSVTVKKNALWQEACDDGTQEYILLDSADNKDSRNTQRIYDRSLVEDNASNFVEVFAVHPAYMTREELDRWEAFQKVEAKPQFKLRKDRASNVDMSAPLSQHPFITGKKPVRKWTPARRKAHSEKLKAVWAAKKAA